MQGDRGAPAKTYDDTMRGKLYTNTARKNFGYGETLPIFELALSSILVLVLRQKTEKKRKDMRGILCKLLLTDASLIARDPFARNKEKGIEVHGKFTQS